MDVYIYRADLWCGKCIIEKLIGEGKARPSARNLPPAEALQFIIEAHGYQTEHDYDSDRLPKGPYPNGGGEADSPQHCARCSEFLQNPLTKDGEDFVRDVAKTNPHTMPVPEWRKYYSYLFE